MPHIAGLNNYRGKFGSECSTPPGFTLDVQQAGRGVLVWVVAVKSIVDIPAGVGCVGLVGVAGSSEVLAVGHPVRAGPSQGRRSGIVGFKVQRLELRNVGPGKVGHGRVGDCQNTQLRKQYTVSPAPPASPVTPCEHYTHPCFWDH